MALFLSISGSAESEDFAKVYRGKLYRESTLLKTYRNKLYQQVRKLNKHIKIIQDDNESFPEFLSRIKTDRDSILILLSVNHEGDFIRGINVSIENHSDRLEKAFAAEILENFKNAGAPSSSKRYSIKKINHKKRLQLSKSEGVVIMLNLGNISDFNYIDKISDPELIHNVSVMNAKTILKFEHMIK